MSSDILQVQGINEKGFGTIAKLAMTDDRLSIYAKAIYSYFCSYAGAGKQAFPRVTRIIKDLQISKNVYYKHFNQLKEYGYIKACQEHKNGRLSHNIYTLMQEISERTALQSTTKQDIVLQDTVPQDIVKQDTIRCDTNNINNIDNKQLFKNISQSSPSEKPGRQDEDKTNDTAQKIEVYTALIKDNIGYSDLAIARKFDLRLIDEFIAIILDVVMTNGKNVRIGDEDKPRELVKHNLLRFTL